MESVISLSRDSAMPYYTDTNCNLDIKGNLDCGSCCNVVLEISFKQLLVPGGAAASAVGVM